MTGTAPAGFNAADYLLHARIREGVSDKPALLGTRSLSYRELSDEVARVAGGLRGLGLRTDDRVMLVMSDDVEMVVTILAAFHAGLVAVPVSTMLGAAELEKLIVDSGARAVVATPEFAETMSQAVAEAASVEHVVVVGELLAAPRSGVTLHEWKNLVQEPIGVAETGPDSWALWLYTSGTTGTPKAALHRHANIKWVYETYGKQTLKIRSDDICLSVAKLFFAYGIGNSLFFPLAAGATSLLMPSRPTPESIGARLAEGRPTLFFAVPTFYATMVNSALPADALASVRLGVSAGEALPAALQEKFRARFGVDIIDGIGSTEVLHIYLSNREGETKPGTTGKPVPGYDVEIRDDSGTVVGPGTPGRLYVRGESIALGYWHRTDASRSVFEGPWLSTGDTYMQDDDGYYHCLGRSNDLLKAGGIWVSPAEVESRLLAHPAVAEAAVVGVPDSAGLDKPVAAVVLVEGSATTVTADELIGWCREELASFKRPRDVVFVDELPKTATGKIQRFRVRQQVLSADSTTL
ncbi:benzoate-CoA ligase family protein [Nocardia sp. CA-135398]|uniref:benzoate-CoA ligase family protein n=1 Tax=Nocardia sp. CA-135398 TaxID=3239977 RepID=UPI003D982FA5